jgi:glycosyltransferase involved in cell wall biosynthesis
LDDLDPQRQFAEYSGEVSYDALPQQWRNAEVAVFASSCENQPNVLIEAMASSMPIACADRGPMPEVLGDAGLYFDPERADSIAATIATLATDPVKRAALARRASDRARGFSWARCADETFGFLMDIARQNHR